MNLYASLIRPLLFLLPPEAAHDLTLQILKRYPRNGIPFFPPPKGRETELFGLTFPSPVGLAAGLDKNGVALSAWEQLGFGFIEVGTITALPQPGNPQPRLFRFPKQKALINRMGFNNKGAKHIAQWFDFQKRKARLPSVPLGINIGKSKATPLEEAPSDYARSFSLLESFGDYFVINVSSPNTPGLRTLQTGKSLQAIIKAIRAVPVRRNDIPLLIKIAPDLNHDDLLEVLAVAEEEKIAGLIIANTTLDHAAIPKAQDQQGGLSGAPLMGKSTSFLREAAKHTPLPLIGSGGIMHAQDAREKFLAGASLVQIFTGLIYSGPSLIRDISRMSTTLSPSHD